MPAWSEPSEPQYEPDALAWIDAWYARHAPAPEPVDVDQGEQLLAAAAAALLTDVAMDAALASSFADFDALAAGVRLADFECSHGRLPGDTSTPCGCYPSETREAALAMAETLLDRAREAKEEAASVTD